MPKYKNYDTVKTHCKYMYKSQNEIEVLFMLMVDVSKI